MRHIIYTYLIFGLFLICTSCSTRQYQTLFQQKNAISDSAYNSADAISEYRIKAQDVIQVRNLQDTKFLVNNTPSAAVNTNVLGSGTSAATDQNFQVDDDGTVILPAIGRIKVAGYTRVEAQKLVEESRPIPGALPF